MRRALISTFFVLALAVLLWMKWGPMRSAERTSSTSTAPSNSPQGLSSPQIPSSQAGGAELQKPGGPYVSSDPRWAIVRQRDKVDHNWEWKEVINFFGRVVDENDIPISAARVDFSWTDLSPAGNSTEATLSGSDGAFSLKGKTGRVLQVDVSKDGFYKVRNERLKSFDYAGFWEANYYEPESANPVTFHLRRKGAGEILSAGEAQPPVSADGTPVRVDLLSGARVSPNGQVEIAAMTNTQKYPPRVFDWQASIAVPDGGLIEHNLEFPFEAPEGGYKSNVEFNMPANAPDWKRSVEKSYFIRFGNPPRYGRIHLRLNGASQKVFLSYAVNPSGSRNLEATTDEPFSTP